MCGILGICDKKSIDKVLFRNALNRMEHRGPDSSDVFIDDNVGFGHRRLSIIDLSANGNQPMYSKNGRYVLIFNGEIYNYRELKSTLIENGYTFKSDSDTEVLLELFHMKGLDCIPDLEGMFSFSIYDKDSRKMYIVRDRLGIKPLYYYLKDGVLIFASEIKSILHYYKNNFELNRTAFSSYLSFRYPILNDSYFKEIISLAPGHHAVWDGENFEVTSYWNAKDHFKEQQEDKGEAFYLNKVKDILNDSISKRMISDVPYGAFLSGGVDSSIVSAIMALNSDDSIKTFTIGFSEKDFNEFEYAKIIADRYKTNHKEISISGDNYISTMESLISYKDGPLSVPNEVPLYLMCKELKKDITVVLSGEGADEIFSGYGRIFRSPYDYERYKNGTGGSEFKANWKNQYGDRQFDSEFDHFYFNYSYNKTELKQALFTEETFNLDYENQLKNRIKFYFDEISSDSYYNKITYAFENIHLQGLLNRVDTTSMAASVEARVPFVDHRLVQFAYEIPVKYKLKWINEEMKAKAALKMSDQISERYDIPKYILKKAYEAEIDKEILYRKKMGFPVPLNQWFGGEFNTYAKDLLLNGLAIKNRIFNKTYVEKLLSEAELNNNGMLIWMMINIELFLLKYFEN